jgi:hypothetical protein
VIKLIIGNVEKVFQSVDKVIEDGSNDPKVKAAFASQTGVSKSSEIAMDPAHRRVLNDGLRAGS